MTLDRLEEDSIIVMSKRSGIGWFGALTKTRSWTRTKGEGRRSSPGTALGHGTFDKGTTRPESPWSSKARKISAFPRTGDRKRERNGDRVDFHGRMEEGTNLIPSRKGRGTEFGASKVGKGRGGRGVTGHGVEPHRMKSKSGRVG